jgi:hypothetical protein
MREKGRVKEAEEAKEVEEGAAVFAVFSLGRNTPLLLPYIGNGR